ncbi:MAG: SLBB domain-containing protein, partial [Elusimicrobiota bacterium]|nr:SLBB domain-containing protein [Elusimicrobiota bacterium]
AYEYQEKFKLFDLITAAGGLTQFAGAQYIKVHRGEPRKTITVNFEEVLRSGDLSKDFVLEPGDIVEVPRKPKSVSVIGEVGFSGTYEWYKGMTVLDAISAARGYTATARLSGVKIFREVSGEGRKVISVDVSKILAGNVELNLLVEPGDIISVPRKPFVGGSWFVQTILPWLSLISLVLVIIAYAK